MRQSPFLQSVESFMRVRRYSKCRMSSYLYWLKYFILFNDKQHPKYLGDALRRKASRKGDAFIFEKKYYP
jgi:hypothetical protein